MSTRKNMRKNTRKNSRKHRRNTRRNNMFGGENPMQMLSSPMANIVGMMKGGNANAMNISKMTGPMGNMPPATNTAASNAPAAPMAGGKMRAIGTRAEVMHGTAHHTSGGLTRKDLKYNKHGRIVSRKASAAGQKALKRLVKAGYKARKGTFKLFKKHSRKSGSRKH